MALSWKIALNSLQHLGPCHILTKYSFEQSCLVTYNTSVSLPPTILVVFFIPHLHVPVQEFSFVVVCKVESLSGGRNPKIETNLC